MPSNATEVTSLDPSGTRVTTVGLKELPALQKPTACDLSVT
ncbi:MAG: hypothetical protein RMI91_12810 [Gemmatales bacterium]|nr:hypothetical protein [Gemmatales bacterium]MDW7995523.1 hypothetical protein [Gemmatales bacterium]